MDEEKPVSLGVIQATILIDGYSPEDCDEVIPKVRTLAARLAGGPTFDEGRVTVPACDNGDLTVIPESFRPTGSEESSIMVNFGIHFYSESGAKELIARLGEMAVMGTVTPTNNLSSTQSIYDWKGWVEDMNLDDRCKWIYIGDLAETSSDSPDLFDQVDGPELGLDIVGANDTLSGTGATGAGGATGGSSYPTDRATGGVEKASSCGPAF